MQQYDYPRLEKMLLCGCPFKAEIRSKAIRSIKEVAIREMSGIPEHQLSDTQLLNSVCVGMEEYLISYRTRTIFKQELKTKLTAWVRAIESAYGLNENPATKAWPDYVTKDLGIDLVKLLHERYPGVSKHDLMDTLKVSKKTMQNSLRKLDPKLSEVAQPSDSAPFRIGGHAMHVDIHCEEIKKRGDRSYYTPNTLHPLVFQFNVTQTAATLMALQNAYDRGEYGTYCSDVALDIWCQLTDYCKERIRLIFTLNNPEFKDFLDMLEQDLEAGRFPDFKTEYMMAEGATIQEQLDYAYKDTHKCNITLNKGGAVTTYQKIRIFKNDAHEYFFNFQKPESSAESTITFTLDDVKRIELL